MTEKRPSDRDVELRVGSPRRIGPVVFEVTDSAGAISDMKAAVEQRAKRVFAFCNMHTFNLAVRSADLARSLQSTTVFNDGLGVDIASQLLCGSKFPENLNGTDLTPRLLGSLGYGTSVFLVGSSSEIVQKASERLQSQFPNISIVGSHHGFFNEAEGLLLVATIKALGVQLLIIGMGNPRQELWATSIRERADAVILCVGAFLDFAGGHVPRAPVWIRSLRCEWLYRLILEPRRLWRRYLLGTPSFLASVLVEKLKG